MARVNPRLLAACAALAAGVLRGAGVAAQSATPSATVLSSATTTRTASGTASFLPGSWGVITTVAGNGVGGFSGDGGPGTSASLAGPRGVAMDSGGNLLIADSDNRIRRLAVGTGNITTVAGNGVGGSFSGDGGPATSASLSLPTGVALDGGGNVFIADWRNHRIRRVAAGTGVITTVAGNGWERFGGDGGPGTSASLSRPFGVAVDGGGNVLIADSQNNRIRRLAAGTGVITTVAGTGTQGFSGDGDGGPATSVRLNYPYGVAVDGGGNVFIADGGPFRIRRVDAGTGVITTVAGNGVEGFSGDGGPGTSASLWSPSGVAVDGGGNVFIADTYNHRIRRLAVGTGVITTVAGNGVEGFSGDGGPGTSATLRFPTGVAVDGGGNVLIADWLNHRIRRLAWVTAVSSSTTATPSWTPSTTPYCAPSLFRPLPRTDLVGSLVGTALSPGEPVRVSTDTACRKECCDAPACDGYSFVRGVNDCYLFVNVSQLVPNNGMVSGLRESVLL